MGYWLLQCTCEAPPTDSGGPLPGMPVTGLGGAVDVLLAASVVTLLGFGIFAIFAFMTTLLLRRALR
jgi:hypothetical protein